MKVVQINSVCGIGSTGRICVSISRILTEHGTDNRIFYCYDRSDYPLAVKCANNKYIKLQALKSRVFGNYGYNSTRATKRMIAELRRFAPDIVHLHNIHGHDCNLAMLFEYLKSSKIKVVWTFHDAWAFTGYCAYFTMAKCDKWKSSCDNCAQRRKYSWFFDRSEHLFNKKKNDIDGLDLTIVTPSEWLADLSKQSFLGEVDTRVINNGIDLSVFKPTPGTLRNSWHCEDKFILLGVAFDWGKRKGLDVFKHLANKLDDRYQIVLVGTDERIERELPDNIITIRRTNSAEELAQIYSAADLLVNPTREENFPTVNIESLACGTPVLTFRTGGSPEIIDESCGKVVDCEDIDALEREIEAISAGRMYASSDCVARASRFGMQQRYEEYVKLYHELTGENKK